MLLYFREINKLFTLMKTIKYSLLLSAAVVIIDLLNIPSKYIVILNTKIQFVLVITLILFVSIIIIESKILHTFRIKTPNELDLFLVNAFFILIFCGFAGYLLKQLLFYKLIFISSCSIILLFLIIYRSISFSRALKKSRTFCSNVNDLKNIYDNKISRNDSEPILVREKEVEYDLLKRDSIINRLHDAIVSCNTQDSFVISLEGKWGSGKTTIINNVKKRLKNRKEIVIIDDFDPWLYSDQVSLLYFMFDSILKKCGITFSFFSSKKILKYAINVLVKKYVSSDYSELLNNPNKILRIKQSINNYLKLNDKKIIFIIDNIDRADNENIILLFKMIGTVLNIDRIIFVLSFDETRVKELFTKSLNIDYQYLKKIIQMPIRVPEIPRTQLVALYSTCIENLLLVYGETNIKEYQCIYKCILKQVNDIREFKRIINSVFPVPFCDNSILYKRDLLGLEFIRFIAPDLYRCIYDNRQYFISYDKIADEESYIHSFDKKEFNNSGKDFFVDFFKLYSDYIDLLSELFPYVRRYKSHYDLEADYSFDNDEYTTISNICGVSSAKYFDLYFTYGTNEYLLNKVLISSFIIELNTLDNQLDVEDALLTLLSNISYDSHKDFFEKLENLLKEVNKKVLLFLAYSLFKNIHLVNQESPFLALSAHERVLIIIADIMQLLSVDDYRSFLSNISSAYSRIYLINKVIYWLETEKHKSKNDEDCVLIKQVFDKICSTIITESINLYDDIYYLQHNIWGLYHYYKRNNLPFTELQEYIASIINEQSVYRAIFDVISFSTGTRLMYSIQKENYNALFKDCDIDFILRTTPPKTEDEKFILSVYKKYNSDEFSDFDENGIIVDSPRVFKL